MLRVLVVNPALDWPACLLSAYWATFYDLPILNQDDAAAMATYFTLAAPFQCEVEVEQL